MSFYRYFYYLWLPNYTTSLLFNNLVLFTFPFIAIGYFINSIVCPFRADNEFIYVEQDVSNKNLCWINKRAAAPYCS